MSDDFTGSGWAFPLRTDAGGGIALVSHGRELEESIRLILGTAPGERPMRPEFGCRIHDEIFAGVDAGSAGRIAAYVRESLRRWEPRIDVDDVEVSQDAADPAVLYIEISYTTRTTNDRRNLVFPFYTIPEEAQ
jgi:phage baseplate assembly protein W